MQKQTRRGFFGWFAGIALGAGGAAALSSKASATETPPAAMLRGRKIKKTSIREGMVVTYLCAHDAYERWDSQGWMGTAKMYAIKFLRPKAYEEQRRPYETIILMRRNGQLDYENLVIKAHKTEAEALKAHEFVVRTAGNG